MRLGLQEEGRGSVNMYETSTVILLLRENAKFKAFNPCQCDPQGLCGQVMIDNILSHRAPNYFVQ